MKKLSERSDDPLHSFGSRGVKFGTLPNRLKLRQGALAKGQHQILQLGIERRSIQ